MHAFVLALAVCFDQTEGSFPSQSLGSPLDTFEHLLALEDVRITVPQAVFDSLPRETYQSKPSKEESKGAVGQRDAKHAKATDAALAPD